MVTFQERHPIEHIVGFIAVVLLHILGIFFLIWMMRPDHEVKAEMQPMQVQVVETSSADSAAASAEAQPPAPEMIVPPTPEIEPPPINVEAPPQQKPPPKPKQEVKKKAPKAPKPAAESSRNPSPSPSAVSGTSGQGGSPTPGVGKPDRSAGSRPINGVQMIYPADMEEAGKEGRVTLACDIETSGATSNCRVVSSNGGSSFVSEAMRYVRSARYRPATKNGMPVKELGHNLTVTFRLGG